MAVCIAWRGKNGGGSVSPGGLDARDVTARAAGGWAAEGSAGGWITGGCVAARGVTIPGWLPGCVAARGLPTSAWLAGGGLAGLAVVAAVECSGGEGWSCDEGWSCGEGRGCGEGSSGEGWSASGRRSGADG
jgi:hypothetical protein